MKKNHLRSMTEGAMIAALYVCLTWLSGLFGLASGAVQLRLSEALCILPYFTAAAVPGLSIGCLLANILVGSGPLDILFGTLATLLGAIGTRLLRRISPYLTPWPTVLANILIVPPVIIASTGVPFTLPLFLTTAATVGLGEVICCAVLGIPFLFILKRYRTQLFGREAR